MGGTEQAMVGVPTNKTHALNHTKNAFQEQWRDPKMIEYRINGYVLGTAILLGMIMVLRILRNRTGWPMIKFFLLGACYLAPHTLSYVLGKLSDYPYDNDLVERLIVVWAVFLIVLDGMATNAGSESLGDNEATRKRFLWDRMVPSIWFLFILLWDFKVDFLCIPLILLWLLYLLKLSERKQALMYACRSRGGLDQVAVVIEEYMKDEHAKNTNYQTATLEGYKYLVGVKQALELLIPNNRPPRHIKELRPEEMATIATIDEIWACQGDLLKGEKKAQKCLKETCLSFALFWILLRRFADFQLDELSEDDNARKKCWEFVTQVLIKEGNVEGGSSTDVGCVQRLREWISKGGRCFSQRSEEGEEEFERPYRVVEGELLFLQEYLFSNSFAVYSKGAKFVLVRLVVFALYVVVCVATVDILHKYKHNSEGTSNTQILLTEVIIFTLSVVELVQMINTITSRWNKVKWICSYVQNKWWEPNNNGPLGRVKVWLLSLVCARCFQPFVNPWHRKLRQYSLLDSYGHCPKKLKLKGILNGYIEFPMKGQKEDGAFIRLSKEVKEAVILSLKKSVNHTLRSGVASLNLEETRLKWAPNGKSSTRIVLELHIATCMCEYKYKTNPESSSVRTQGNDVVVATSLSKYCAYLVAFTPNLLPEHVYLTQWLFEEVVHEATETLVNCQSEEREMYEKLMSLVAPESSIDEEEGNLNSTILVDGAILGQKLINEIYQR